MCPADLWLYCDTALELDSTAGASGRRVPACATAWFLRT